MAHYIDKDALVAEMRKIWDYADEHWDVEYVTGARRFADKLEDAIDTLEVKEVDLEKEVELWYNESAGNSRFDWNGFAKHFFELGLNTKVKQEDKVI